MSAAEQWAHELDAWRIDPEILAAAPESPWGLPPELFAAGLTARSPLVDLAVEVLRPGGSVLDVGAGAGAASLPLFPPAQALHAVDSQPSMLDALAAEAARRGIRLATYEGTWPEVAPRVPVCDVAVCANVFYNVPDLAPFAVALTERARHRVLVELHAEHPLVPLGPLWEHFHGQSRPSGPTAELAVEVLREIGIEPAVHRWTRPAVQVGEELFPTYVAFTRRRLCLPASRDAEVAAMLPPGGREARGSVVLTWPGSGG